MTWLRPELGAGVLTLVTDGSYKDKDCNLAWHAGTTTHVSENRNIAARALGVAAIQWLEQVHGTDVEEVTEVTSSPLQCDAVWTRREHVGLAIMTADCVPVLVASNDGAVVGAAHAGWQGLEQGVLGALIGAMPCASANLCAWIGPAISAQHYEVGEDVWSRFPAQFLGSHIDAAKRYLDLTAIAAAQLKALGISVVGQAGICVYADEAYYSHRASRNQGRIEGRFATCIARRAVNG